MEVKGMLRMDDGKLKLGYGPAKPQLRPGAHGGALCPATAPQVMFTNRWLAAC
jgi:hypothetical protein